MSKGPKDTIVQPTGPLKSPQLLSLAKPRSVKHRSLASLAMSDIPDIYTTMTPPSSTGLQGASLSPEEVEELISADAAERVLLRILRSLDSLKDLFAAAEVSRGFYRTFKKNELPLLRNALWKMSPAAWELRESSMPDDEEINDPSKYKPNMYFRHYVRDLLTMVELKAMILDNCKSFLRQETIQALAGETERSLIIDDAFWRVWTFCRIFGCGRDREDDIVGQMDWLRGGPLARQSSNTNTIALLDSLTMNTVLYNPPPGFARGNMGGLTAEELYDMTEIWTCLGVLVGGYHGRCKEAREYGIFDSTSVTRGNAEEEDQMPRGMDALLAYTYTNNRTRCHFACHTDTNNFCSRTLAWVHPLATTSARRFTFHFPQGSCFARVRRTYGTSASGSDSVTILFLSSGRRRAC